MTRSRIELASNNDLYADISPCDDKHATLTDGGHNDEHAATRTPYGPSPCLHPLPASTREAGETERELVCNRTG